MRILSSILLALGLLSAGLTAAPAQDIAAQIATDRAASLDSRLSAMKVEQRFTFGTGGGIRNTSDLAKHFEPYQAWTGPFSIGNEGERYKLFHEGNHVFDRDTLWLVGKVDRKKYRGDFGLQSAILAKPPQVGQGGTQLLWLKDWPAKPFDGAMVGYKIGGLHYSRKADVRVVGANAAAKLVVVHPPITDALKAGDRVRFGPPVTSGQIWSKATMALGKGRTYALNATIVLPGSDARGAWSAVWLYGKNDATNRTHPRNGDELDLIENYKDGVRDNWFSGNNHPISVPSIQMFGGAGWKALNAPLYSVSPKPLAGEHRLTIIVEPTRTLRYLDGELVKVDAYQWGNPNGAQIGVNLAIGSYGEADGAPNLAPRSDADFAAMRFGVKSLTVYAKP